jgi:hypothetical protein
MKWEGSNFLRICYSMHSSLKEIRDVVSYLKPKRVRPNVVPLGSSEREVGSIFSTLPTVSVGKPAGKNWNF